jgi:hypothetical protein
VKITRNTGLPVSERGISYKTWHLNVLNLSRQKQKVENCRRHQIPRTEKENKNRDTNIHFQALKPAHGSPWAWCGC